MRSKTILFVVTSLQEGGAGKMVHHIAGLLAKEYSKVYAIATNTEEIFVSNNGVHYLEPLCEHQGGILGFSRTIIALRKIITQVKPDIIITFVGDIAVCTRIATLGMRGLKVISAERGDPFTQGKKWDFLTRWAYKHSDWCFFQLPKARDYYGKKVVKKSFVIPNAAFFEGKIGCHVSMHKTIVSAGRFVWEKGFDTLIAAFSIVYAKYPEYKLVLYGEGPFQKEYEKQLLEQGLIGQVSFPGYTNNIGDALKNEDIFVLPSRYEGIPNVLIEAMLVGIPTVSCDCNPGGPSFLTKEGNIGTLVPVDDINAIAEAILQLIEDRELYKKYEKEGPRIIDDLNPSVIEKQWLDAFHLIDNYGLGSN